MNWSTVNVIFLIMLLHWIGDFIMQTRKMGQHKSTSNKWLAIHVGVYAVPLCLLSWKFALINAVMHAGVDFVSSRMSSAAYKKNDMHMFWVIIGADQYLHMLCLVWSYMMMANYGLL